MSGNDNNNGAAAAAAAGGGGGGGGSTTTGGIPVALRGEQYYEETGTLGERLCMVMTGLVLSPFLAWAFSVIAGFVTAWLWAAFLAGFVAFLVFHVFDTLVHALRWWYGGGGGGGADGGGGGFGEVGGGGERRGSQ